MSIEELAKQLPENIFVALKQKKCMDCGKETKAMFTIVSSKTRLPVRVVCVDCGLGEKYRDNTR